MPTRIRVYELAKDLNMKSKTLLEKLKDMNIKVGSHVSSLDDDTVARIRGKIFGAKSDPAEVRRAKQTVIRRRKKRAPEKSDIKESDLKPSPTDQEPFSADADLSGVEVSEADQMPEAETADRPAEGRSKNFGYKSGRGKDVAEKDMDDVAGLTVSASQAETPQETALSEEEADGRTIAEAKKHESAESAKGATAHAPRAKPKKPAETAKTAEKQPAMSKGGKSEHQVPKGVKKKRRKRKKEMPAKIIKLPTKAEEEAIASEAGRRSKVLAEKTSETKTRSIEKKPVPRHTPGQHRGKPAPSQAKNGPKVPQKDSPVKDKKKKVRTYTPDQDRGKVTAEPARKAAAPTDKKAKDIKWTKKKISFKRKEVVDGAALYAGGQRGKKGRRNAKIKTVKAQKPQITTPKAIKRRIKIDDTIILSDLAKRMGIKAGEMIKKLMMLGVMVTVNQTIDFDTAVLVASEFEYELERASFEEEVILSERSKADDPDKLIERSPVVTIMGHVDHGKTSLLDVIRETRITEMEAGGITQHIGAYNVSTSSGQVTFLDTPGHEAFTAMRARGAKVTDLVVLVVAADDGVMPQTIEAINHSKAAEVPIIVAVNKIDKANADTDRVYRELSEQGLVPEDWGGDTIFVRVSAKLNQGIDQLLEMILLQSEVLELKANPDKLAVGYVVESKLDPGRGAVATVLIQEGTLKAGDPVVCGIHHGKIRAMLNDRGVQVDSAGPSIPVGVLGLSGVPNAGDELVALGDDKRARQVSEHRIQKERSRNLAKTSRLSLEKLFEKIEKGEVKDLNIIIKADVHGSIEALRDSLVKLSNDEVSINVIHSAPGTITESDVSLATVSDAIIIGFNVRPTPKVQAFANEENVDMRFYNIIYNVIKDIQDAILGMMSSTYEERVLGRAEIRDVFHVPKVGAVAGCYVLDGKIQRGQLVRLLRDGIICYEGKLASLRRFKDDVKEVRDGYECGIGIENYNDIKIGDVIECYYLEEIKPEL